MPKKKFYRESGYSTDHLVQALDDISLLEHMGVPLKVAAHAVQDIPMDEALHWWIGELPHVFRPDRAHLVVKPELVGHGLILHGPTGTRKTTTAARLLLKVIRMQIPNTDPTGRNFTWHGCAMGRFVDWQVASDLFRRAAGQDEEVVDEAKAVARRMRPGGPMTERGDFLVLDDVSRERRTEFNSNELHRILRERHSGCYPTIITTNHDPSEWDDVYGEVMAGFMGREFTAVRFG